MHHACLCEQMYLQSYSHTAEKPSSFLLGTSLSIELYTRVFTTWEQIFSQTIQKGMESFERKLCMMIHKNTIHLVLFFYISHFTKYLYFFTFPNIQHVCTFSVFPFSQYNCKLNKTLYLIIIINIFTGELARFCIWSVHRYTPKIPEPVPSLSRMGLKLELFGFPRNQNNCDLSGAYVTCMQCSLSVKTNTRKMRGTNITNAFVFACVMQKPEEPKLSPIADVAMTQGDIEGQGSVVYICEFVLPLC